MLDSGAAFLEMAQMKAVGAGSGGIAQHELIAHRKTLRAWGNKSAKSKAGYCETGHDVGTLSSLSTNARKVYQCAISSCRAICAILRLVLFLRTRPLGVMLARRLRSDWSTRLHTLRFAGYRLLALGRRL